MKKWMAVVLAAALVTMLSVALTSASGELRLRLLPYKQLGLPNNQDVTAHIYHFTVKDIECVALIPSTWYDFRGPALWCREGATP
jgi:hypothetical protein